MQEDIFGLDRKGVDSVRETIKRTFGWGSPSLGGGSNAGRQSVEMVVVALIGAETGSGLYKGSALYGQSNGSDGGNPSNTAQDIFQLQSQTVQTATDGPAPLKNTDGTFVNNVLVCNLPEVNVVNSHELYAGVGYTSYVLGRLMGQTAEATPRMIVYVDSWSTKPAIVKITSASGGISGNYTGRVVQGPFVSASNFLGSFPLSSLNTAFLPGQANCTIINLWEQVNAPGLPNKLPVGTYVFAFLVGLPTGAPLSDGNSNANNLFYGGYCWQPIQIAALVHGVVNLVTSQVANSTYNLNEQTMLNNLKTDMGNVQSALSNLVANLTAAGYLI